MMIPGTLHFVSVACTGFAVSPVNFGALVVILLLLLLLFEQRGSVALCLEEFVVMKDVLGVGGRYICRSL